MDLTDKYLGEGRSSTPKYVVDCKLRSPKWANSGSIWKVKDYGKPTEANLAKYAKRYNDSLKPGQVNDHLGKDHEAIWLGIRENYAGASYIAEWGKK